MTTHQPAAAPEPGTPERLAYDQLALIVHENW